MPRSPTGSRGWCTPAATTPSDSRRGYRCSEWTPGPDPTRFYGFGKAACEALCSLYHDRHGLTVACLRIGSFRDRPTTRRHLSTWLSPGDTVRLVDACLRAPDLGFAIVYGISATPVHGGTWIPLDHSATSHSTTPRTGPPRSRARRHRTTTTSTDGTSVATSLGLSDTKPIACRSGRGQRSG